MILSTRLRESLPHKAIEDSLEAFENHPLHVPDDGFAPDLGFVAAHRVGFGLG